MAEMDVIGYSRYEVRGMIVEIFEVRFTIYEIVYVILELGSLLFLSSYYLINEKSEADNRKERDT